MSGKLQNKVADCNEDALKTTVTEFNEAGYDAFGVKVNVDAVAHFGRIDILVNNAGVGDNMQATANVQDTVWQRVMDINVTGMMRAIRQALPVLIENGGGTIVNMALIAGLTGGRGGLAYTNAKHAVVGMTKNIASHYGPQNIRCNAIAPGHVETGFAAAMTNVNPFGMEQSVRGVSLMSKTGQVSDIANIALFLASEDSGLIYGLAIAADAGWSTY
ncbi:NAD(P)-dependent dehydrogenase (short-subunit alcohol dehydrogenase family) [Lysinibacillus parviboronicapiens]|uniref:NAD(P)-dependent dehydrogenase (Short-subunit alcohol dehydrogenase family) n=1 Tax=Lysinibacillus parviboronicapiens TaxID=436516 RepID=A0ABV2PJM4_9BACI